jgi:hypothetical protein
MAPVPQLPHHLTHKPLVAIPYSNFDGPYAGNTDAFYLSIGKAQWDHDDVSAKVWRHSEARWSRQSEELPLHRPIDLTILITAYLSQAESGRVRLPAGSFENQDTDLDLPVFGASHLSPETQDLIRRRLGALVRRIAIEHPSIIADAIGDLLKDVSDAKSAENSEVGLVP